MLSAESKCPRPADVVGVPGLQEDRKAVRQAREAVRLPEHLAKEILKDTTRKCARKGCSGRASASN